MKAFALKIALSTFLLAAPAGAALAAGAPANSHAGPAMSTLSGTAQPMTRMQVIDARIAAAEANLPPMERGGYVDPHAATQAQADLISIRQAMADGSRLSDKAYRSLTSRLRGVEQLIDQAQNG